MGVALAVATASALAALAASTSDSASAHAGSATRPNFIVITTDDQAVRTFTPRVMPRTYTALVNRGGTVFNNSFSMPPLCCPDRAGFITGEYPHNSGVFNNHPGYADLVDPGNILPAWLSNAGYRTALVGKYLNGTSAALGPNPAPGWDHWFGFYGREQYWGASFLAGHRVEKTTPGTYATDVLNKQAVGFVKRSLHRSNPFFLWLTQYAPHTRRGRDPDCPGQGLAKPAPGDFEISDFRHFHRTPNFNERDVSDKPPFIADKPPLDAEQRTHIRLGLACAKAALRDVDRGVGQLVRALKADHALHDTVIVFTSDNGFFYGEHRLYGKFHVYEEGIRVPLVIRVPPTVLGTRPRAESNKDVAEIDLAPTILSLAGVKPCEVGDCRRMDGRSLTPLLRGQTSGWPADRGLLSEIYSSCRRPAIRTTGFLYVDGEPQNCTGPAGFSELYDLRQDPYELQNVIDDPAYQANVVALRSRLEDLRRCSGVQGRNKPIPGTPFCE